MLGLVGGRGPGLQCTEHAAHQQGGGREVLASFASERLFRLNATDGRCERTQPQVNLSSKDRTPAGSGAWVALGRDC